MKKQKKDMLLNCIAEIDINQRKDFISNIVLCGGTCKLKGLANRMEKEIQLAYPPMS